MHPVFKDPHTEWNIKRLLGVAANCGIVESVSPHGQTSCDHGSEDCCETKASWHRRVPERMFRTRESPFDLSDNKTLRNIINIIII